jgi:2,4-diketo-3-deoxy-L-fuconate hydrolase
MRLINANGRLSLERPGGRALDVERASKGVFGPAVQEVYARWPEFCAWAATVDGDAAARPYAEEQLGSPVPAPRQIFAIGMNYRAHAAETGMALPGTPMVFTKFATSITGPFAEVTLPAGMVDWEVELVAVIGREARNVPAERAWDYVAGLTAGQDLSERTMQLRPPAPQQFSLAKSFPGFAPLGPALVTPDSLSNPDDLELSCAIGDELMQKARTSDMIFGVPALIAHLSSVLPLLPGDVIFTGTPGGVGITKRPPRFLQPGELLTTHIEGIGTLRNRMRAAGGAH